MKKELLSILALGPVMAVHAHAEVYMTAEKAASQMFPGEALNKTKLELDQATLESVSRDSGQRVISPYLTIFRTKDKGAVFIDQVIGKHEFITFAVGVDPDGKVRGVEILEYRETYGHQVKEENWKKQFVGKTLTSPLKLDDDIRGISGATLSSAHVTAGVRRLLHTYDKVKDRI